MHVRSFFAAIILVVACACSGAGLDTAPADTAASRSELSADLDSFILATMRQGGHPGLAAAIIKNGQVAWSRNYGVANWTSQAPVTDATTFMLASVSKTVTATAALQLWERGQLDLDADVNNYLPFPVRNPRFPAAPITARMLLLHTSSINDNFGTYGPHLYTDGDSAVPLGTFLDGYFVTPGVYHVGANAFSTTRPGEAYRYSNIAIALLGYVVERVSGVPFHAYTQAANIFGPVGHGVNGLAPVRPRGGEHRHAPPLQHQQLRRQRQHVVL